MSVAYIVYNTFSQSLVFTRSVAFSFEKRCVKWLEPCRMVGVVLSAVQVPLDKLSRGDFLVFLSGGGFPA